MITVYASCPRCLGDLFQPDPAGSREFSCLQCGGSGEVIPGDEYVARKAALAATRRKPFPAHSLAAV